MNTNFKKYFLGLGILASIFVFAQNPKQAKASDGNFGFNVTYSKASIAWNYIDASTVTITQGEWVNLKLNTIWNLSSGCWPGADAPRCTPDYTLGQANTVVRWSQDTCPAGVSCYWYSRTGPTELTTVIVPNFTYGPSIQISNTNVLAPGTYPIVFKIEEYPTACQQSGGTCIPPKTFTVNLVVQGQPPQPAISAIPTSVSFTAAAGGAAPAGNNITVKNIGNGTLNWSASLNQNWCHLNTTSGALMSGASATLSVWVDAPSNVGTFTCTVTFSDPNSSNGSQGVAINYTVTSAPPPPPPSSAGSPILTSISPNQATLSQVQAQMTMDVFGSQFNPVLSNNLPYYTRNADGQTTGISAVSFIPGGIRIYVPANFLAGTYTVQILNGADFMNLRSNGLTFTVVPDSPKAAIVVSPANLSFSGFSGGVTPGSQGLVIKNTGTADLNWTAATDQAWCHISPASGTLGPNGVVTANITVDAPSNTGNFNCNVSISGPNTTNSPQTAAVSYQVSTTPVASQCDFTNTSFRYLKFDNIYPVAWAAWKELEFYDTAGNKLKPTIIGGSTDWIYPSQGAYGKPAAIDGDIYTQWNGADVGWVTPFSAPVNIILDFGKTVTLGRMRFLPQNTTSRNVNIWVGNSSSFINTLLKSFQGNYFEAVWVDFNCITGTSTMSLAPANLSFAAQMGDLPPAGKAVSLQNTGAINLDWSASTDQSWCHVGPPSGNLAPGVSTSLTVTVDAPSNVGTFNCNVTVSSTVSPSQSMTVSYTVSAATPATVSLSPSSFIFSGVSGGSAPTGQALSVKNTGVGNLTWYATLNQAWCHISPSSGIVSPGSSAVAMVTVDTPTNVGSFNCSATITGPNTTNGPQNSGVTYNVTVPLSATMVLSNNSFVFSAVVSGAAPAGQPLTIRNSGKAALNWTATANQAWCRVSPSSGSLLPGATATATVSVDAPFGGGAYNCGINVSAPNTTNSPQAVSAVYNVTNTPTAIVSLSPTSFQFLASSGGGAPSAQILSVRNVGNANLNWSSASSQPWCHISPSSGTVAPGGSAGVNVSVDQPSNVGTFGCSITVYETASPSDSQQVAVSYKVDSSVVVNPSQVIAASVSCGSITVSWQTGRNATGYNLYRNTTNSMPSTIYVAGLSSTSYEDLNVSLNTKYFYWVASMGSTGGATPADVNSSQGVPPSPCEADLTPSDKNLNAINGVAQPHNDCDYNQFQGAPQDKTLKNGDILTFGINVCNIKGTAAATTITLKDKLLNLDMPANGFNAKVDGQPLAFVSRTPLVGEYAYDPVNFQLDFNLGSVAKGLARQITYDAQVKTQLNNATGCVKCQSQTVISFRKDTTSPLQTIDLYTPPIFYSVSK